MEIINTRLIKIFVLLTCLLATILTSIPIILYSIEFKGDFSKLHSDWGIFGDYIGGTVGTIFNLIAVIFSFLSIYITLKIATRIHENEQKFNIENSNREKEKFDREIELIQKQNKPFPVLDFDHLINCSQIILSNQGPGTLIVTKFEITNEGKVYRNFGDLISLLIPLKDYDKVLITFDSATKHIVTSGGSKHLFEIYEKDFKIDFQKFNKECKSLISKTKIKLFYEDIFENKYEIEESLNF